MRAASERDELVRRQPDDLMNKLPIRIQYPAERLFA